MISTNEADQHPINRAKTYQINTRFSNLILDDPSGLLLFNSCALGHIPSTGYCFCFCFPLSPHAHIPAPWDVRPAVLVLLHAFRLYHLQTVARDEFITASRRGPTMRTGPATGVPACCLLYRKKTGACVQQAPILLFPQECGCKEMMAGAWTGGSSVGFIYLGGMSIYRRDLAICDICYVTSRVYKQGVKGLERP